MGHGELINVSRAEKILNQIDARQSITNRKIETRKKILLGALLIELIKLDKIDKKMIEGELNRFLLRDGDRVLFGLPARGQTLPLEMLVRVRRRGKG